MMQSQQQMPQQGHPQQMMQQQVPMQPGMPQQGYAQQQGYPDQMMQPQQQGYPQQQMQSQQQMPQQGHPQQMVPPQQQMPIQQQPVQQQVQQQVPQAQPAAPASGLGPDGIDWEAEAAALESGADPVGAVHEAETEEWDGHEDAHLEDGGYLDEHAEAEEIGFLGEQDDSREGQKKRKEKGKKSGRRNGGACLLVALVLLGAVGGAGWWGYGFYQNHFGPPPDYTGEGTGSVQVEVKKGAVGGQIGLALKNAGVVKSVDAFTTACNAEPKCGNIQYGYYGLKKEMPAAAALNELLTQAGGAAIVVPEGKNSTEIYALIDGKLKLQAGTTAGVAKAQVNDLGLPAYANGNIEGFLWPTRYNLAEGMKPEDLLKQMVKNATEKYANLDSQAASVGLKTGYEVLIEASILQREGNNPADFAKMAKTIQNRLAAGGEINHKLGMDTTLQYSLGRKDLDKKDMDDASNKYNTYINPGLPPGPISNPGDDALNAVLHPADGKWLYFIAMSPTETRFAETSKEHYANVKEYCQAAGQGFDEARGHCTTKK
ncbi:endolytic transglycosylase MltG [Kitasatospora sp. SUK 42]|uniref:endolytic transglycosylase MltG n=1 Tax=Kitasatospora sp. SUK 42 TaxID=1588882 RepID=UPI0018C9C942|nr:endolytic transglycosylase MltG [Kitasatospora sp. SUK 42]MBV2155515.1 endolytic transglycosylase MltG [Kitasatospora sp. SUK 42]